MPSEFTFPSCCALNNANCSQMHSPTPAMQMLLCADRTAVPPDSLPLRWSAACQALWGGSVVHMLAARCGIVNEPPRKVVLVLGKWGKWKNEK